MIRNRIDKGDDLKCLVGDILPDGSIYLCGAPATRVVHVISGKAEQIMQMCPRHAKKMGDDADADGGFDKVETQQSIFNQP